MSQEGAQTLMRNAIKKKIPQSYHEESEVIQLMVYPNFCLESRRPKAWGCDIDIPEGSFHMCSGKHDVHLLQIYSYLLIPSSSGRFQMHG